MFDDRKSMRVIAFHCSGMIYVTDIFFKNNLVKLLYKKKAY